MSLLQIENISGVQVISSTIVAEQLGIQHKNLLETIVKYQSDIESAFGQVAFETRAGYNNAQVRVAFLSEDQAIFIATLSRNSEQVVQFKANLVQSFQAAKRLAQSVTAGMNDAQLLAHALQVSQRISEEYKEQLHLAEAKVEYQESVIKAQAPKTEYYDRVLSAKNSWPTGLIASDFNMTPNALNIILKEKGIQRSIGGVWVLTSDYLGLGYEEMKTINIGTADNPNKTTLQLRWTQKGREWLHTIITPIVKVQKPKRKKAVQLNLV